ncbi:MAG TPA: response regulator [Vicinamibacterales bacterium]
MPVHASSVWSRVRGVIAGDTGAPEPLNVLVVDDEPAVRRFVERVLSGAGMRTWSAQSGDEALAMLERIDGLDLLLTDLMMPSMKGDELARRVQLQMPDLRILYLTGFSDDLFSGRIVLAENEAFLVKPSTAEALLQAVALAAGRPLAASGA